MNPQQIQQMMKQAQQMQERLQQQMAQLHIEATAGGGMVTVTVNGAKQLERVTIEGDNSRRCVVFARFGDDSLHDQLVTPVDSVKDSN